MKFRAGICDVLSLSVVIVFNFKFRDQQADESRSVAISCVRLCVVQLGAISKVLQNLL